MRLVFIAGPYTAPNAWQREMHVRAAESQSLKLWRVGVPAICVHTIAQHFHGEVAESDAIAIDDEILRRCDAVLLCPGWQDSPGTIRERAIARSQGKPVFLPSEVEDCITWAQETETT